MVEEKEELRRCFKMVEVDMSSLKKGDVFMLVPAGAEDTNCPDGALDVATTDAYNGVGGNAAVQCDTLCVVPRKAEDLFRGHVSEAPPDNMQVNADVLRELRNHAEYLTTVVDRLEARARRGQKILCDGDVTFNVTPDRGYVVFEDVANGSNVIEVPSDWFEDIARKFLKTLTEPTDITNKGALTVGMLRTATAKLPKDTPVMVSIKKDSDKYVVTRMFLQPDGEDMHLVLQHCVEDLA